MYGTFNLQKVCHFLLRTNNKSDRYNQRIYVSYFEHLKFYKCIFDTFFFSKLNTLFTMALLKIYQNENKKITEECCSFWPTLIIIERKIFTSNKFNMIKMTQRCTYVLRY